jgi:hypothetical protein
MPFVSITQRSECGSKNPVEIEVFSAVGASKLRGVMWSISWEKNKKHYETNRDYWGKKVQNINHEFSSIKNNTSIY